MSIATAQVFPPIQEREAAWRRAGRAAAMAVGLGAAAALALALAVRLPARSAWPATDAAVVLTTVVALLLLSGYEGRLAPWPRRAGWSLAGLVLVVASNSWAGGPLAIPGMAKLAQECLLVLVLSLLSKRWLPRLAVVGDLAVALAGYTVCLGYLFGAPQVLARAGRPMPWETALALLLLAGSWMAVWPQRRPVSLCLETSSAAVVLRRLMPAALLYPAVLVAFEAARAQGDTTMARVAQLVLVGGSLLLAAGLVWLLATSLDRRDAMVQLANLELRASERRYRQQFDNSPQPMWVFSIASLRFLAVNDSAVRELGYTRDEFLTMTVLEIRPPEDRERARALIANGQPAKGWLWRYRTKSGELLEAEAFAHPIDWHGEPAFFSFINDVTSRRRAEQQLRDQEEQVHRLLESTSEGIYTLDLNGKCVWCNPAAATLLGLSASTQLEGKQVHALAHHTRSDGTPYRAGECQLLQGVRSGVPVSLDEELLWRADGASFPADIRCNPLYRNGELVGAVIAVADVTERRSLRNQFQQAQKMDAVGRLAAGIAHDFNNLLTVINGYTDMLLQHSETPLNEERQFRALDSIRKAGERAAGLTRQLLTFSRQQVIEPRILSMNIVLEDMEGLLRRVLSEEIELHFSFDPHLGSVRTDAGQLGQILMNLVVNARDAMPQGGTITVETANVTLDRRFAATHGEIAPGDYVMLAVTDAGVGMDETTQSHLFEPFFTTKPVGKGTGLGLATVFGIVKQNSGAVSAYSELGRGTSIKIYLPRVMPAAESGPRIAPGSAGGGGETILLVEDEEAIRRLAVEILQEHGYRVLAAAGPRQALELLQAYTGELDLVVSDLMMPDMDGRTLVRQIRARRPGLAVLYASGFPDQALRQRQELELGMAFIQKPFAAEALLQKVRALLDTPRAARAAAG